MKKVLTILVLGVLVATAAPGYAQIGNVSLAWTDCLGQPGASANMNYTTATSYHLVASIVGSALPNNGHRLQVAIGPNVPEAWRFDAGGCQDGQMSISHATFNKACPAFQGGNPLGLNQYSYDAPSQEALLDIANTYDLFTPVPATTYALWRATFNHAFSTAGDGDPSQFCRFAGNPLCFVIATTEILNTDGSSSVIPFGAQPWVTWNSPTNTINCPAVPAEDNTTWGRVKGLYR